MEQKIVYTVVDNVLKRWTDELVDDKVYQLKENEHFGERFTGNIKLSWNGLSIVNNKSEADADALISQKRQTANTSINTKREKGRKILDDTLIWMEEKLLASSGGISQTVYDNTIDAIENILLPLKDGRLIKVKTSLDNTLNLTGTKEELRIYILGLINTQLGV